MCIRDRPYAGLDEAEKELLLYGSPEPLPFRYVNMFGRVRNYRKPFPGILNLLQRRYGSTESEDVRQELARYMEIKPCPACRGLRLKESSLAVLLNGLNIAEISAFTVDNALTYFQRLELTPREAQIARQVLKEIVERLQFLNNVGPVSYTHLDVYKRQSISPPCWR